MTMYPDAKTTPKRALIAQRVDNAGQTTTAAARAIGVNERTKHAWRCRRRLGGECTWGLRRRGAQAPPGWGSPPGIPRNLCPHGFRLRSAIHPRSTASRSPRRIMTICDRAPLLALAAARASRFEAHVCRDFLEAYLPFQDERHSPAIPEGPRTGGAASTNAPPRVQPRERSATPSAIAHRKLDRSHHDEWQSPATWLCIPPARRSTPRRGPQARRQAPRHTTSPAPATRGAPPCPRHPASQQKRRLPANAEPIQGSDRVPRGHTQARHRPGGPLLRHGQSSPLAGGSARRAGAGPGDPGTIDPDGAGAQPPTGPTWTGSR
jgi:hypothetical protein